MPKAIDLTGQKFGRWTVMEKADIKLNNRPAWLCVCECGKQATVRSNALLQGKSTSCGCSREENFTGEKHGFATRNKKHQLYSIWSNMKNRCNDSNNRKYHLYGGKGIKVCSQWDNFLGFHKDMYESYLEHVAIHGTRNTSIDRIDSNKDYSPDNCRWATYIIQGNNTSKVHHIEFNGETHTLREWADITGMPKKVLENRIFQYQWTIEDALTLPLCSRPTRRMDSNDTIQA